MSDYQAVRDGIESAYALAASHASEQAQIIGNEMIRPSVTMRPTILRVYDARGEWRACYGDPLQESVMGFGSSPALACEDFDKKWWGRP